MFSDIYDIRKNVPLAHKTIKSYRLCNQWIGEERHGEHMDMNAISNITTSTSTSVTKAAVKRAEQEASTQKTTSNKAEQEASAQKNSSAAKDTGVVYEKNKETETVGSKKSNKAIIAMLKADAEKRTSQLRSIVEQMMTKQGAAIGNADDMWKFLAKGDFTVSADVKAQAEKDIAEDGYWGVEQTSDRILDFAKALAGNDPKKADAMLDAFKKGFEAATKTWGDKLPDISQRTYDAVLEKMDAWKNEGKETTTEIGTE